MALTLRVLLLSQSKLSQCKGLQWKVCAKWTRTWLHSSHRVETKLRTKHTTDFSSSKAGEVGIDMYSPAQLELTFRWPLCWKHQRCSVIRPLKHKSISMGKVLLSEEILFRTSLGGFGFVLILNSFQPEILGFDSYILTSHSCLCRVEVRSFLLRVSGNPCSPFHGHKVHLPVPACSCPVCQGRSTSSSSAGTMGTWVTSDCPVLPALPGDLVQTGRTDHTEC